MFTTNKENVAKGDVKLNDTPEHCMINVMYKLKNKGTLSEDNLSRIAAPDITGTKMESRDFMQWALLSNIKNNVELFSRYFEISKYADYLKTLSLDTQQNLGSLFIQNNSILKQKIILYFITH